MKLKNLIRMIFMVASYFALASAVYAEGISVSPASDFEYEYINEWVTGKGKNIGITIKGYKGTSSNVIIPELIEGLPVKTIDSGAFKNNKTMNRIEVPSSVNKICAGAFNNCYALKEAYLNLAPIAEIGECVYDNGSWYAFLNCPALTTVVIEAGIKLDLQYGFSNCNSLQTITLPNSARTQGWNRYEWPFVKCPSLKTINYRGPENTLFMTYGEDYEKIDPEFEEAIRNGLKVNYDYIGD